MATRSVPGLLMVTGGLLAKTVIDRSLTRRHDPRKDAQAAAATGHARASRRRRPSDAKA